MNRETTHFTSGTVKIGGLTLSVSNATATGPARETGERREISDELKAEIARVHEEGTDAEWDALTERLSSDEDAQDLAAAREALKETPGAFELEEIEGGEVLLNTEAGTVTLPNGVTLSVSEFTFVDIRPDDSRPGDAVATVNSHVPEQLPDVIHLDGPDGSCELARTPEGFSGGLMLGAMHCPTPHELADVVSIGLPAPRAEEVLIHLGICDACHDHAMRMRGALRGLLGKPEKYLPPMPEIRRFLTPPPPATFDFDHAEKSPHGTGRKARRADQAKLRQARRTKPDEAPIEVPVRTVRGRRVDPRLALRAGARRRP